ncbi:MAG: ATP synthase F1 subunit gamma [Oscillospiraceae bacterium]|nr:ATP synthase F1 subunit gamma [Oscillospiraceae bacterium]
MAGVSTKEIKNRIRSMESTKQITKAMEMVAASKLRKAQNQVLSSRPYFEILYATINDIVDADNDVSSIYLRPTEGKKPLYVVIAGDRGLAGGYNSNVCKLVLQEIKGKDACVLPMGKKATEFFKARQIPMLEFHCHEAQAVTIGDCFSLAKRLCKLFRDGEYDRLVVAYTSFVSVLSQTAGTLQMLPLPRHEVQRDGMPRQVTVYEPGSEEVFERIIPEYLGGILYGALCESRASEQAARRTAMDSATKNAEEMIADLSLKFNRARQAAITQEITEIVAGSKQ